MSTEPFDPVQYKAGQRQEWDALATGWKRWWEIFEGGAQHLSDRLVELAQIEPGQRVVDVATGVGEPALTAARRVGPTGRVVATDLSGQMLAVARERAGALGLSNIDFCEMDAESLDLPEGSFNAILCRWGLMFLPNLPAALSDMRRLLVPGGRLASAVWDVPAKVPFVNVPAGVIREMFQVPPPPAGTPGPFSLADAAALEEKLMEAGFEQVRSERLIVTFRFPSIEVYTRYLQDISNTIRRLLVNQPAERVAEVWQAVSRAARDYTSPDGSLSMPNEAICVVGWG